MSDDEQAGSAIDALGTGAQASENLELAPDIFMQDLFVPDFAAAAPAPVAEEPMLMVVEPTATEEAFHLMDPVYVETPVFSEPPVYVDTPIDLDASMLDDDVDVDAPVFVGRSSANTDSEGTTPDVRLEISDRRLGPLATWVRTDQAPISMSASGDDLRSMLGGLAVPNAVAAVGYPRGVRIRRVRVPAAREPRVTEGAGAVILSKRLLAEQRELREQPRA
jgi:hypothetical protein